MSSRNQSKSLIEPIYNRISKSIGLSLVDLIYNVRLRMTLRKTVHAESFLVQSKDTLNKKSSQKLSANPANFHYVKSEQKK